VGEGVDSFGIADLLAELERHADHAGESGYAQWGIVGASLRIWLLSATSEAAMERVGDVGIADALGE
jgi:hypothetical protein